MAALEIKRFHHSKRNKKGILCEIIMPAAFVCLAMCMTLILPGLEEEPALEMSPWIYPTKVFSPIFLSTTIRVLESLILTSSGWREHTFLCE